MPKKIVKYQLDPANMPPLTKRQQAELAALKAAPDSGIDYSDIPPLDSAFWKNAMRNPFYKPPKVSKTVRVDADVLLWLKSAGKGYQTRLNTILRAAMLKEVHKT